MKITLFTDADVFAGTERHILDLALALREEGLAAEIACPDRGVLAERARSAGVSVFPVEKHGSFDLMAIRSLRDQIVSGRIDILHAHNGRTALIATLAVLFAGRGSVVLTQHFLEPARVSRAGWRGWLGKLVHGWILKRAAHVVAISDAVRSRMIDRREVDEQKVSTVWNGITDPSQLAMESPDVVRSTLGVLPKAPLIVCAARLEPEKAIDVLIEAMVLIRQSFPEAHLLVAGEGRLLHSLQQQIASPGLDGAVRLVGFRPDVLALVRAADLFVLSSPAEPFGLALVEAMALGRPVVAVEDGGPVEIVINGVSGLLVRPRDPSAMAQAILSVLSSSDRSAELGIAARQRFVEAFTSRRMGREMIEIYDAVSGRQNAPVIPVRQTPTNEPMDSLTSNHGLRP